MISVVFSVVFYEMGRVNSLSDVCGRAMRICHIDTNTWGVDAKNRAAWRLNVKQGTERGDAEGRVASTEKRARKKRERERQRESEREREKPAAPESITVCVLSEQQRLSLKNWPAESLAKMQIN